MLKLCVRSLIALGPLVYAVSVPASASCDRAVAFVQAKTCMTLPGTDQSRSAMHEVARQCADAVRLLTACEPRNRRGSARASGIPGDHSEQRSCGGKREWDDVRARY